MESVITYPCLHPLSAFTKPKLGRLTFSAKEIADGSFLFTHHSSLQLSISNIRADGNRRARPAQRNSESGRSINGDDNKTPQSSEGTMHNKDEILALFRRIQSSISGETASKGRTNNPSAESVLEVLRQSRKPIKGKTSNREGSIALGEPKKEPKKDEKIDFASAEAEVKTSRLPSNFVKRSPIPSTLVEKVQDEVKSATNGEELQTMKLVALKELARSRGIKGYSKLKKGELIELLKLT
ncbi:SAP-like protein BP-73 [Cynara cardunculus var. scolymus]|uniref:Rho termination factor-like N-terminal domain-containing protein n=1 Tax=Cynara cardunculus var. scolymus TaxID=59895 RepID=A0A118JRR1_CYNCS|nr:SAP-like protein BP-73 [Cynara cardunculus var. scolymus]KVH88042.1 hypothetical protein Ccrd_024575 [Cynara cardunculus var. scolymus]